MTLRQIHIPPCKTLQISRPRRDSSTADFKLRNQHLTQPRIIPEFIAHLLRRERANVTLRFTALFKDAEPAVYVPDDHLPVPFYLLLIAKFRLVKVTIHGVIAGIVAADEFRGRVPTHYPGWRALEARYPGALERCHLRQDLYRRAAVADEADAFVRVVVVMLPARAVDFQSLKAMQPRYGRPLPMTQDSTRGDQDVRIFGARTRLDMSNLKTPLRTSLIPARALDIRIELHVAVQLPFLDRLLEIIPDLPTRAVEVAPIRIRREGKHIDMTRHIALYAWVAVRHPRAADDGFTLEDGVCGKRQEFFRVSVLQLVGEDHAAVAGADGYDAELFRGRKCWDGGHGDFDGGEGVVVVGGCGAILVLDVVAIDVV